MCLNIPKGVYYHEYIEYHKLQNKRLIDTENDSRQVVIYARVSTKN